MKAHRRVALSFALLLLSGCEASQQSGSSRLAIATTDAASLFARSEELRMWMTIGKRRFAIALADNEAARRFVALSPLTLQMSELNGNEKHGELPEALPTNASKPG